MGKILEGNYEVYRIYQTMDCYKKKGIERMSN